MPNNTSVLASEYVQGSMTPSVDFQTTTPTASSETTGRPLTLKASDQPATEVHVDIKQYGVGKPRRVLIRGKISK